MIKKERFTFESRKNTLLEIRQNLLTKHSKFMRLNNDKYFESLDQKTFQQRLINANELKNEISVEEMKTNFKKYERTRHFQIWHDGSTIANYAHIMFVVNVLYDEVVFYTNAECETLSGIKMDMQSLIETPELYLLGR